MWCYFHYKPHSLSYRALSKSTSLLPASCVKHEYPWVMSLLHVNKTLVWQAAKQIVKCYTWLYPFTLRRYKLPPYSIPTPVFPHSCFPPAPNIPRLYVWDFTYSKAFHALLKNTLLWLSKGNHYTQITPTLCDTSEVNLIHKNLWTFNFFTPKIFSIYKI